MIRKKHPIGHMPCPECDCDAAEILLDKNAHAYRWCPLCNGQYFTRGDPVREQNLRAKMRAVPSAAPAVTPQATDLAKPPASVPVTEPVTDPIPIRKRIGVLLDQAA